jgi:hypothetical protein
MRYPQPILKSDRAEPPRWHRQMTIAPNNRQSMNLDREHNSDDFAKTEM